MAAEMPYMNFRNMSDEDLASVVAYLRSINPVRNELAKTVIPEPAKVHRTVTPVQHRVDNTEVPTFCEVCRSKHGYGDKNHSE